MTIDERLAELDAQERAIREREAAAQAMQVQTAPSAQVQPSAQGGRPMTIDERLAELDRQEQEIRARMAAQNAPAAPSAPRPDPSTGLYPWEQNPGGTAQTQTQNVPAPAPQAPAPEKPTVYGQINPNAVMKPSDFAAKGKRGAVESAGLERAADTGVEDDDYDGSWWGSAKSAFKSFFTSLTGGTFSKSMNANLQALARGTYTGANGKEIPLEQLPDSTLDYVMDQTGANGFAGARSIFGQKASHAWRGSDNIMRQWDEQNGAKFKDEAERKRARVEYAKELARNMLSMQEETKLNAESELGGREETVMGSLGRGLLQQGGYTAGYMVGPYGIVAGTLEGVGRANELMSDKTKVNERGEIVADAKRDAAGTAIAKGAARGVTAPLVELVGGKLLMKGVKGAVGATIGSIPIVKEIGGKLAQTAVGKAVAGFAKKMDYVGRMTGMGSFPEEMVEEWEDQVLDAAMGTDRRASENEGTTALGRAAESTKQFFTKDNMKELATSMLLMQVLQGGAAHAMDRRSSRQVDAILENICGLDRNDIAGWTANQKQEAFNAWVANLGENEVKQMVDGGTSALNRFTSEMFGGRGFRVVTDKKGERTAFVQQRRGASSADDVNEVLRAINASVGSSDFIQRDADGNPIGVTQFTAPTVTDAAGNVVQGWQSATDEGGNAVSRLFDEKSGISIDRYENADDDTPQFRVFDSRGRQRAASNYQDAVKRANEMAADKAVRDAKLAYVNKLAGGVLRNEQVFVGDSIFDIRRNYDAKYGAGAFDQQMANGDGEYFNGENGGVAGASMWLPETDANGNSMLVQEKDANGNPVYETRNGKTVAGADGRPVPKMVQQRAVFIVLGNNNSVGELNATAYHEAARHSGLAKMYTPEEKAKFLKGLCARSFAGFQSGDALAGIVKSEMDARSLTPATVWKDANAVEEIFARVTERMTGSPTLKQRFMAEVRSWYRKNYNQELTMSPDEVAVIVGQLNDFAKRGRMSGNGDVTYGAREGGQMQGDVGAWRTQKDAERTAETARQNAAESVRANEQMNAERDTESRIERGENERKADLLVAADEEQFKAWCRWQGARDDKDGKTRLAYLDFMNGGDYALDVTTGGVKHGKTGNGTREAEEFRKFSGEEARRAQENKTFKELKDEEEAMMAALAGEAKARGRIDKEAEKNRAAAEKDRAKFMRGANKAAKQAAKPTAAPTTPTAPTAPTVAGFNPQAILAAFRNGGNAAGATTATTEATADGNGNADGTPPAAPAAPTKPTGPAPTAPSAPTETPTGATTPQNAPKTPSDAPAPNTGNAQDGTQNAQRGAENAPTGASADYPVGTVVERDDGTRYIREEGEVTDYATGKTSPKWREMDGAKRAADQEHVFSSTKGGETKVVQTTQSAAVAPPTTQDENDAAYKAWLAAERKAGRVGKDTKEVRAKFDKLVADGKVDANTGKAAEAKPAANTEQPAKPDARAKELSEARDLAYSMWCSVNRRKKSQTTAFQQFSSAADNGDVDIGYFAWLSQQDPKGRNLVKPNTANRRAFDAMTKLGMVDGETGRVLSTGKREVSAPLADGKYTITGEDADVASVVLNIPVKVVDGVHTVTITQKAAQKAVDRAARSNMIYLRLDGVAPSAPNKDRNRGPAPNAGYSYEAYAKETGDEMALEYLRTGGTPLFAIPKGWTEYRNAVKAWRNRKGENRGEKPKMSQYGVDDPLADWMDGFFDGSTSTEQKWLFGFSRRGGGNDGFGENVSPVMKNHFNQLAEQHGESRALEMIAEEALEAHRKFAKWREQKKEETADNKAIAQMDAETAEERDAADADEAKEWNESFGSIRSGEPGWGETDEYELPLNAERLGQAKNGDVVELADGRTYTIAGWDADSGVLTVEDNIDGIGGFKVTDKGVEELKDEAEDSPTEETNNADPATPTDAGFRAWLGDIELAPEQEPQSRALFESMVRKGTVNGATGENIVAPAKPSFKLESATADELKREKQRQAEREEIARRLAAPLKGGAGEIGQNLLDLGGEEGGDLFNTTVPAAGTSAPRSFSRGERVFIEGVEPNARVTFMGRNADGTAKVQVVTPGANRYAPQKTETRNVGMDEVHGTGEGAKFRRTTSISAVTPEEDKAYMDAVKRGDMETATAIVDKAIDSHPNLRRIKIVNDFGFSKNVNPYSAGSMPKELVDIIASWKTISKSPYSDSFYNSDNITWNSKPDRSLRVADHWNFYSRGEKHCITDKPIENVKKWAIAEYHKEDGKYHILQEFDALGTFKKDEFGDFPRMEVSVKSQYLRYEEGVKAAKRYEMDNDTSDIVGKTISYNGAKVKVESVDGFGTVHMVTPNGKKLTCSKQKVLADNPSLRRHDNFALDVDSGTIKSADPVTFDDAGNPIPLSERFRTDREGADAWRNSDIRFRRALTDAGENGTIAYLDGDGITFDFGGTYDRGEKTKADSGERGNANAGQSTDGPMRFATDTAYSPRRIVELFGRLNADEDSAELARRVFQTADRLGVSFAFTDKDSAGVPDRAGGAESLGRIALVDSFFASPEFSGQQKADSILHEAIHGVTSYAIDAVKGNVDLPKGQRIGDALRNAVNDLDIVMGQVEGAFRKSDNAQLRYGVKNLHEFAAQLSRREFREELKKIGVWKRVVNAIQRIVDAFTGGGEMVRDNAHNASREALERILDNYDVDAFNGVRENGGAAFGEDWKTNGEGSRFRRHTPDANARLLADALNLSPKESDALANAAYALDTGNTHSDTMPENERELVNAADNGLLSVAGKLLDKASGGRWNALKRGLERRLVDYLEPVKNMTRLVEHKTLRRVNTSENVADAAKFAYSRQTRMWEDAERGILAPMHNEVAKNKLDAPAKSIDGTLFHELLLALHGPAFNRMIAERTKGERLDGSGASTQFWLGVLRADGAQGSNADLLSAIERGDYAGLHFAPGSVGDKAAGAVAKFRELTKLTRDTLVKSGRLSQVQADTWESLSPFYAPMRFDQEAGDNFMKVWLYGGTITDGDYTKNYTGPESKHAFGHRNIADNPVAFAIQQLSTAIQRSTDNGVRRKLADMVRRHSFLGEVVEFLPQSLVNDYVRRVAIIDQKIANGTASPAEIAARDEMSAKLSADSRARNLIPQNNVLGADGIAHLVPDINGAEQHDNVVAFKEGGDTKFVVLGPRTANSGTGAAENDALSEAEAKLVGRAIKKTSLAKVDGPLKFMRKMTSAFGMLRTTMSPEFLVSNFLADNAQAAGNLYATYGAKAILQFEKSIPSAVASAVRMQKGKLGSTQMDVYAKEMRENGLIGGIVTENFRDIQRDVNRAIAKFAGDRKVRAVDFVVNLAERMNAPFEQATRLAAYSVVREQLRNDRTISEKEKIARASKYAREVTVDFNQKGEWGPVLNSLYAFSNAALVDMGRSFGAFAAKRGIRYGFALAVLGFLSSMMGYWQDDPNDEREGKPQWKDTKDYVKQNKLGVRMGDSFLSVPIRGINRQLYYLGHQLYEAIKGKKTAGRAAWDFTKFAMENAFDPIGDASNPAQAVVPSFARPGMEMVQNKSFTGAQLYREPMNDIDVRSEMGRTNTQNAWKWVAKTLNSITGGNRDKRGLVDVQPEKVQQAYSWLTGSLGNDVVRAINLVSDIATGDFEDLNVAEDMGNIRNVPFVRRFASGVQGNSATFREKQDEFNAGMRQFKDIAQEDEAMAADLYAKHPFFGKSQNERRWREELEDLQKTQRKLMKVEMSTTGEDRKEAHALRMKVQAAFIRRMDTPPAEDADNRQFDRATGREASRAIAADKRTKKREELEKKRRQR